MTSLTWPEVAHKTDPIFEVGRVPNLPHCEIQQREYRNGKWHYAIRNNYNPWGSGWADEDFIISEIAKAKKPATTFPNQTAPEGE